jgi:alpha-mannosidase
VDAEAPLEVILIPHTHWDREWYEPFEAFLARLVQMMDLLIELADREPRFRHFHLDGQSALIDDYLAVRPEREPDVRRLAREGRISVGPWFTQMDEFLTSGESHIRNLEWGMARAKDFGADLPVAGYLPDQFGHIGQMPQILRRGGLDRAVVWRGVPAAVDKTAFWWEAPDGSRVLTEYMAFGYSVGMHIGQCEDVESLRTALGQAAQWLQPYSTRRRLMVMVGTDHTVPAVRLAPLLEEVNAGGDVRGRIGSIREYLETEQPAGDIPKWRGELRSAARAHLLPNVYSARVHQKQRRATLEALIERYAEPLAALVPGFEWPERPLREAWRRLLWNGAHDSVCGCSVDEVAEAVDRRFDEAEDLASRVRHGAMEALAARMSSAGWMYFNPSPFERFGVPGLGWDVRSLDPRTPWYPSADLEVDAGRIIAGDFSIRLVDEDDIGDLYTFCPSERGTRGASTFERHGESLVAMFDDGLQVELRYTPHSMDSRIELRGTIMNRRPDHRLRLHVALAGPVSGSVALAPFEVVERPLRSEGGTEAPSPTWPARGAVLAGGVAAIQQGVFEYEVIADPPELALTLLRCVGTISRPQLATRAWAAGPDVATPQAQMIGDQEFSLHLRWGTPPSALPAEWEEASLPLYSAQAMGGGDLPASGSLLDLEGAELSSIRKVGGRTQVRIWNPSRDARVARVAGREVPLGPARIEDVEL